MGHRVYRAFLLCAFALLLIPPARAYSVLTHEALIDSAWDRNIKPLLVQRFPDATEDDLRRAHGYAYAGCIIQDMGYLPFGSRFFSDLVHYVRSGDFVSNLIRESQDINEYAFALGSLAHYAADNNGHRLAVNPSVGMEYPKLRRKYGPRVTYEENPGAHLKVEFGFDVEQVARGHYAPKAYHDFIGFVVSEPVLERAVRDTYSLELKDIFHDFHHAVSTYRYAVGTLIPEMTRVAWRLHKKELTQADTTMTQRKFIYNLSRASYRKEWPQDYQKPAPGAWFLSVLFRIVPKVGPFKAAGFKIPTPQTVKLFEDSFDKTFDQYRVLLAESGRGILCLQNRDFDTGEPTRLGEYKLADKAYSELAMELTRKDPKDVDRKVVENILAFYRGGNAQQVSKDGEKNWRETQAALNQLETAP